MSSEAQTDDLVPCKHCDGTGKVKRTQAVAPWSSWQARNELARNIQAGDRWIQIKSGRVAVALGGLDAGGCIPLRHENGRTTTKWRSYFASEFTPETPPA